MLHQFPGGIDLKAKNLGENSEMYLIFLHIWDMLI